MSTKEPIIIGVDHGNANIKTKNCVFPSGITCHGEKNPGIYPDTLKFQNEFFNIAFSHDSIERDKTKTNRYYILTVFAIIKEMIARGYVAGTYDIILAIGLPPGYMNQGVNNQFKNYFDKKGLINAKFNDDKWTLNIKKSYVFPQGLGAMVASKDPLVKMKKYMIIDIGGGTVEYIAIQNGMVNPELCQSLPKGTITVASDIIKAVSPEFGIDLTESDIEDVMSESDEIYLAPEIIKKIKSMYNDYAHSILTKMRDFQIESKTYPVFLTGGGANYVKNYFKKTDLIPKVAIEENIRANAEGFEILAAAREKM